MKRLLREPLLHFMLIGAALFAAYSFMQDRKGEPPPPTEIRLSLDELAQVTMLFRSQWKRDPTPEEFARLIEQKVEAEVLYREALAMGLDSNDEIVRRRMAQKMQFLSEDVAAAREPGQDELRIWFEQRRASFTAPPRLSFRHLYFSPDARGARAEEDAASALAKLSGEPVGTTLGPTLADPFMFQEYYRDRAPDFLGKEFGAPFAQAVEKLPVGSWQGPVPSGFGWHLVFVDTAIPGRAFEFAEIEDEVKRAWLAEQKQQAWAKAYAEMRAKYTVMLPKAPAEGATPISAASAGESK